MAHHFKCNFFNQLDKYGSYAHMYKHISVLLCLLAKCRVDLFPREKNHVNVQR